VKSNAEWIQWGKQDPLFGVASWPGRQRGGPQAWTDEAFYDLGRSDWADFLTRWATYGLNTTSCVEIGAGAGRLTMHLAATFDQVHAVDVSADMLDYARRHITASNVAWRVTDGVTLPLPSGSITAAFSAHVFQHFSSLADAERYFAELARVLVAKGSLMIHLPIHRFPPGLAGLRLVYAGWKRLGRLRVAAKGAAGRLGLAAPVMRGLSYELPWLMERLGGLGFVDVEVAMFPVTANSDLHQFVFARRSG
jgi:SAM-dependent methyltransferase